MAIEEQIPPHASQTVDAILRSGIPQTLGIVATKISRETVKGEMRVAPMHCNPTGNVNGGAIMSFADTLGAIGAAVNRPEGHRGGTIESKTNFLSAGFGPFLVGESVALHIGRTTSVWQTTVRNADGTLVAVVTQTQISLPATT
jgi:1,4-dihydroxy-2-naphthoyl-CoA hydrolase